MDGKQIRIAIDRGGTFTDCVGYCEGRPDIVIKILSVDPSNYEDAPREGIRRILEEFLGREIPRDEKIDTSPIESIRMGTTVATNALLERKGEACAFVTTKGFRNLLDIGNQSRPRIFDLSIAKPEVLYRTVVEIDERVTLEEYAEDPDPQPIAIPEGAADMVKGLSGETVRICKAIDRAEVQRKLQAVYDSGVTSIAVCFMHSYTFPEHERVVGEIARGIGFTHISLSSELVPMIKMVPRGTSSTADAYLTPMIRKYIDGFTTGFRGGLGDSELDGGRGARCEFMQSDGGLVDMKRFSGLRAILSGPAGGVVGYAVTSYDPDTRIPVIGFDMGGTSTDVSRFDGQYEHVFETTTAGVTIQSPQLDINTVAAGGGSILAFKNGMFHVGPDSASAHPGPACYRKGGPLTVTDANLLLGRLIPDVFPKIFGPHENEGLDIEATRAKFDAITADINATLPREKHMTPQEVALGFVKIANESMCRPIRALTEARGHDVSRHRLASFGGAGGQHACAIADTLGIRTVVIHRYSSVLSAYGMALADVVQEVQEPSAKPFTAETADHFSERLLALQAKAQESLRQQGFPADKIACELYLNMRYKGTDTAIMVQKPDDSWAFDASFIAQHEHEFGFTLAGRDIVVDDVRVRGIGKSGTHGGAPLDTELARFVAEPVDESHLYARRDVYFDTGACETLVYDLDRLHSGHEIHGPAMIIDKTQTIVVAERAVARILPQHIVMELEAPTKAAADTEQIDPVLLSVFGHRFMAIAEQMGRALQRTAVSTNVKERLDFSCAVFDAEGGLVANAPHLPVHLGSMSTAVRTQAKLWEGRLAEGDVLVCNHPATGGTHLPDITTITPAFHAGKIVFYVASRGHHSDIGGITAGSMPPHSKHLYEEGAMIKSELLVSRGEFNEQRMTELLLEAPAQYPNCSGTRNLSDNLSDLKAQVSANKKGIHLIDTLIREYGEEVVRVYMQAIQDNADRSVRELLKQASERFDGMDLQAEDFMDDGSAIRLRIRIDKETGSATFDFSGTSPEMYGNLNAPEAVTYSAIIYCLRCLIEQDIPLNQGCLAPISVRIPRGSLLSPSDTAAVVAGNVCTSQRVTDVVLKAFQACAASQGDCNNLVFGKGGYDHATKTYKRGFGYYETIAGGAGAGPGWHGASGVHTHMTNTRITDPEIFERRYPVLLRTFALRAGSGGIGKWNGGDGVVRDIEFRIPMSVAILSERRVRTPYGMAGGSDAAPGQNLWIRGGKTINLGGKNAVAMEAGDRIVVCTPGGGGYGRPDDETVQEQRKLDARLFWRGTGSLAQWQATAEAAQ